MRFITEDELRTCYKKEPFTSYQLEDGIKLTPGARQFLQDRGILMFQGSKSSVQNGNVPKRKIITDETGCDISNKKFLLKVRVRPRLGPRTPYEGLPWQPLGSNTDNNVYEWKLGVKNGCAARFFSRPIPPRSAFVTDLDRSSP